MRVAKQLAEGQAWVKHYADGSVGHDDCIGPFTVKDLYLNDLNENLPFYCQCGTELMLPGEPLSPLPDSDQ